MALTGITQQQVGSQYHFALGFIDPASGNTQMVGYVLKQGTELEEDTDIQGNDRLIQIASPNSTDRFTYYPKVSQGDWSGGERQYFFSDPTKYYATNGEFEVSAPGQLYALAASEDNTPGLTGNFRGSNFGFAFFSDTDSCYMGGANTTNANPNFVECNGGGVVAQGVVGTNGTTPVHDIIADPNVLRGVFVRVSPGVWRWNSSGPQGQVTNTVFNNPTNGATYSMAYFNGNLYYTDNTSSIGTTQIRQNILGTNVDSVIYTLPTLGEAHISLLRSGGDGLIFTTTQSVTGGTGLNTQLSWLYTWDGSSNPPTRRAQILGKVMDMVDALGTMYIMVLNQRTQGINTGAGTAPAYTLYSFTGSTLAVFDDLRFALPDFRPQGAQVANAFGNACGHGRLHFDGRFLYVGSGGTQFSRYDLLATGLDVCNFGNQAIGNHEFVGIGTSVNGVVETYADSNANCHLFGRQNDTSASNPSLTTSYFDFSTPTTVKAFLSIEVEPNPISTFSAPTVSYRIDNQTSFTNLTASSALANGIIPYYFSPGIKGTRIQFKLTGGVAYPASIRSYSINARLGRVWKGTAEIFRHQRLINGSDDQQGTPASVNGTTWTGGPTQYRLANIENCYKLTAGRCTLFVPSPTQVGGTEQVNAVIQSYNAKSMKPGPDSSSDGAIDMEGTVDLVLVEDL